MWPAIAAAAASVASQMINTGGGYYLDKKLMEQQFKYQKEVLQNQVQWRYEDLKKAGINPILAGDYQGTATSGVTVPSGKSPNIDFLGGLSTAQQVRLMEGQDKLNAEKLNTQKEATKTQRALTLKANAEAYQSYSNTGLIDAQNSALRSQLPTIQSSAQVSNLENQMFLDSPWLIKARALGSTAKDVGDGVTSFMPLKGLIPKKPPKVSKKDGDKFVPVNRTLNFPSNLILRGD